MIELPEAITLARQLNQAIAGKTVARVFPPTKPHKFCFFQGDPGEYDKLVSGVTITGARAFGMFAEMSLDNGYQLCVNDGVNLRLTEEPPEDYQLRIQLEEGADLIFTVAMYGGIALHDSAYDNSYYLSSLGAVSPLSPEFDAVFTGIVANAKPGLSAKALLATQQRIPGVGNGVTQDILFSAGIHPKRKLDTLSQEERMKLHQAIVAVLTEMTEKGGRDTEKDLFGQPGGYRTCMSKNSMGTGCVRCGGPITKEAYLGGSVYYCPHCQPLEVNHA